jgi:hypothetical protein
MKMLVVRGPRAMKILALPARGAPKVAPKKKALPTRGAPVKKAALKPKAKAKAIPASSFAAMAAKVGKTKSKEALAGEGTWYFMVDLRKMKGGADDPKAWKKFDVKSSKILEEHYTKGLKQATLLFGGKKYIVRFKDMMQYRSDDKYLQRPVKRE